MESIMKKLKHNLRFGSSSKKNEEKLFLEKGSIFAKKLIADCNGKSIPIRNFSSSQILKATNNFDSNYLVKSLWGHRQWYKGIIEDKPYLIKKFFGNYHKDVFNDIVFSARMSNHNNFLKLIGCCFEFSFAVVVFEYEEYYIMGGEGRIMESVLTWNVRLKIAKELAISVTYLHTAFSRIIIHKDINPTYIFLDKNWKVKLTGFMSSVSLPEGKSRIQDDGFSGIIGYIDPIYYNTHSLSEYTDVFSFGVCLLVFLTGRSAYDYYYKGPNPTRDLRGIINYAKGLYENGKLDEVIDPMILKDITTSQRLQVEAFVVLALRCCEEREEDRPKMIQVAKELKLIEGMEQSLNGSSAV